MKRSATLNMNRYNDLIIIKLIGNNGIIYELAVTPFVLMSSESKNFNLLKPIDFLTPKESKEIKGWSVGIVLALSKIWVENSTILKQFINAIFKKF